MNLVFSIPNTQVYIQLQILCNKYKQYPYLALYHRYIYAFNLSPLPMMRVKLHLSEHVVVNFSTSSRYKYAMGTKKKSVLCIFTN